MFLRRILLMCLLHEVVVPFEMFQNSIPHGAHVPSPCKPGQTWPGVGHFLKEGSGPRNPFGLDFEEAGFKWTEDLCRKDSDGDGLYNGQELGDPDCLWPDNQDFNPTSLSHPGVCDPWNSTTCMQRPVSGGKYKTQQGWLAAVCKSDQFECPAIHEPDVKTTFVGLPENTPVPAQQATNVYQIFDYSELGFPLDQDVHLVAVEIALNNTSVLHHITILGCPDNIPVAPLHAVDADFYKPCQDTVFTWTVGISGACFDSKVGYKIGPHGYKRILFQAHWLNPEERNGFTDSSGVIMHYTPKLRPNEAGVAIFGTDLIKLAPMTPEVVVSVSWNSECSKKHLLGPIYLLYAYNHMHQAGTRMSVELLRNNEHITYITDEANYSYLTPYNYKYEPPIMILPGDELRITCVYNTTGRNTTTFVGQTYHDEMCATFLTYYPLRNLSHKVNVNAVEISECNGESPGVCRDLVEFIGEINTTQLYQDVTNNCERLGPCRKKCLLIIWEHMRSEPCLKRQIWEHVEDLLPSNPDSEIFLSRLASCKVKVAESLKGTLLVSSAIDF